MTTRKFLSKNNEIEKTIFVVTNDEIFAAYQQIL